MEDIKSIYKMKNVIMHSIQDNTCYVNRKGVIIIEDLKGNKKIIDISINKDITNDKNISIINYQKKTKIKYIFKNN